MKNARIRPIGSVAEWSNAPVSKTGIPQGIVSSNLTASAEILRSKIICPDGEMVDALASGASGAIHGGSSPLSGTIVKFLKRPNLGILRA